MSIKDKIFEAILNGKYLTDTDVAKIYNGKEPSWGYVSDLKQRAYNLLRDRERFDDKEIEGLSNYRRKYVIDTKDGSYYISKDYFLERKAKEPKKIDTEKYEYYYNGNKLYNIKEIEWSFVGHDLTANWKNPKENNREQLGKFYLRELDIKEI